MSERTRKLETCTIKHSLYTVVHVECTMVHVECTMVYVPWYFCNMLTPFIRETQSSVVENHNQSQTLMRM